MDFSRNKNESNRADSDSSHTEGWNRNDSNRGDADSLNNDGYSGGDATSHANVEITGHREKDEQSNTTFSIMQETSTRTGGSKTVKGNLIQILSIFVELFTKMLIYS